MVTFVIFGMSVLIWIQTVWHSDSIPERFFFKKLILKKVRAIPEKNTWEGKTAGNIFFYGWLVRKVFKLYGSKNFLWLFPWVVTSSAGMVYDLCVYYMTGTPEGSTESGFMEKPGIEPATPGLQGIALIHYTTGASQLYGSLVFDQI